MDQRTRLFQEMPEILRLGLATRGNTSLEPEDCLHALDRGVNYWNWCGYEDGMSRAVRGLGARRNEILLAVQVQSTDREGLVREVEACLKTLGTDRLDLATIYYLETEEEWVRLAGPSGALEGLEELRGEGIVGRVGVTSHRRRLAAEIARRRETDLLMIRYNAAHRGAELEIFPVTDEAGIPVVAYTCLRWGELLKRHGADGPRRTPPIAPDCYRFVLSNPSVSVALMAPSGRRELEENLTLLADWRPFNHDEMEAMREWGDHVHRHAGSFP